MASATRSFFASFGLAWSMPRRTLSSADSHGSRHGAWNTTPRSRPGPSTTAPLTVTSPASAVLRPAAMLSAVDLPQPECPTRQTNSPGSSVSVKSCMTTKRLVPSGVG